MYHYFDVLTNTRGDSLSGYQIRVTETVAPFNIVPIFADAAGTPIVSVSSIENTALTDGNGNYSFFVNDGIYNLQILSPTGSLLDSRLSVNFQRGPQGEPGPAGPAGPPRVAASLSALKAWPTADGTIVYDGALFRWTTGNFTGQADDVNIVKSDANALTVGAWRRQDAGKIDFNGRPLAAKVGELLSVTDRQFAGGAKGDGVTNDTAAIAAADAAAAAAGKDLFFPAGTYLTDAQAASANWRGEAGSIIKGRGSPSGFNALVTWQNINGLIVEGLTFDGNCSADPATWTSLNYDSFTGYSGPTANYCTNPQFINCRAVNTSWSGFRFVECTSPRWLGCSTKRARGNFGDGFIAISCSGFMAANCYADDYTRGGMIVDSFGGPGTVITNQIVAITNCWARGGHHASINFGGLEYNSGVWVENAGDVALSNVFSFDNPDRGIIVVTGFKSAGFVGDRAAMTLSNCHSINSAAGLLAESIGTLPVTAKMIGCSAKGAQLAFNALAANAEDSFFFGGCHAEYNAGSNVGRAFALTASAGLSGKPEFVIGPGCTVKRISTNSTFLATPDPNVALTADIGNANNGGSAISLSISGLRTIDDLPVYARWHGTVAHDVKIRDADLIVPYGSQSGGKVELIDCALRWLRIGNPAEISVNGGVLVGGGETLLVGPRITFAANTDIADASKVTINSTAGSNAPSITIRGDLHRKNIATHGPIFQLGDGSGCRTYIEGCRLFNTGSSTTTRSWVEYTGGGGNFTCANVYADSSVTSLFDVIGGSGGVASFSGVTKQAMK